MFEPSEVLIEYCEKYIKGYFPNKDWTISIWEKDDWITLIFDDNNGLKYRTYPFYDFVELEFKQSLKDILTAFNREYGYPLKDKIL